MVLILSAFLENALNNSIMIYHVFSCFSMLETYSRERLGVVKIINAPKFGMYFYEHAECLVAVCFRKFQKVS